MRVGPRPSAERIRPTKRTGPAKIGLRKPRLLAMFVAPFVGLLFFKLHVALIPAVLAPFLNHLLFARPIEPLVPLITVELVAFTLVAFLLLKRNRRLWIAAPLAYIAAKVVSGGLIAFSGWFDAFAPAFAFAFSSIVVGLPGLALMALLHVLLMERSSNGEG